MPVQSFSKEQYPGIHDLLAGYDFSELELGRIAGIIHGVLNAEMM